MNDSFAVSVLVHRQSQHTVTLPFCTPTVTAQRHCTILYTDSHSTPSLYHSVHRQSQHTVTVPFCTPTVTAHRHCTILYTDSHSTPSLYHSVHRQPQHTVTVPFCAPTVTAHRHWIECEGVMVNTHLSVVPRLRAIGAASAMECRGRPSPYFPVKTAHQLIFRDL